MAPGPSAGRARGGRRTQTRRACPGPSGSNVNSNSEHSAGQGSVIDKGGASRVENDPTILVNRCPLHISPYRACDASNVTAAVLLAAMPLSSYSEVASHRYLRRPPRPVCEMTEKKIDAKPSRVPFLYDRKVAHLVRVDETNMFLVALLLL